MALSNLALEFTERGIVPDRLVRAGIRRLLQARLNEIGAHDPAAAAAQAETFAAAMRAAAAPAPESKPVALPVNADFSLPLENSTSETHHLPAAPERSV